jgi:hypothetical protein
VADQYVDALLVERAGSTDPEVVAAIDAEITKAGGTPPGALKPKPASDKR